MLRESHTRPVVKPMALQSQGSDFNSAASVRTTLSFRYTKAAIALDDLAIGDVQSTHP